MEQIGIRFPLLEQGRTLQVFGILLVTAGFIWWVYSLVASVINAFAVWWAQCGDGPAPWLMLGGICLAILGTIIEWISGRS